MKPALVFRKAASLLTLSLILAGPGAQGAGGTPQPGLKVGNGLFQPATAPLPARQWEGLQASVTRAGPALEVRWRVPGQPEALLALPDEMAQVTGLHLHQGRLVVTAWMNGALATAVAVIDLAQARLLDVFWGYGVSVSPDASAIAFVRFHPSQFVSGPEDQYRLYRTALSNELNRADVPADWPGTGQAWRERDVGQPLYPLAREQRWRLNVEVPEAQAHRRLSPLQWSPDGRRLAWLDVQAGRVRLLVAEVEGAPGTERVLVHELARPEALCLGRPGAACGTVPTEGVSFRWTAQGLDIAVQPAGRGPERMRRVSWPQLQPLPR